MRTERVNQMGRMSLPNNNNQNGYTLTPAGANHASSNGASSAHPQPQVPRPMGGKRAEVTINRNKKTTQILLIIAGTFAVCWLPYHLFMIGKGGRGNFLPPENFGGSLSHMWPPTRTRCKNTFFFKKKESICKWDRPLRHIQREAGGKLFMEGSMSHADHIQPNKKFWKAMLPPPSPSATGYLRTGNFFIGKTGNLSKSLG